LEVVVSGDEPSIGTTSPVLLGAATPAHNACGKASAPATGNTPLAVPINKSNILAPYPGHNHPLCHTTRLAICPRKKRRLYQTRIVWASPN
jgi:hypothetical protein